MPVPLQKLYHEFDSAQVCDYCFMLAEHTKPGEECPVRRGLPMPATPRCMTDGCKQSQCVGQNYRGLCMKCYSEAKKLVESNQVTWDVLAEAGLVLHSESPFMRAVRARVPGV